MPFSFLPYPQNPSHWLGGPFETLFNEIFTEGRIGLAVLDHNGVIVQACRAWCNIFGLSGEELFGRRLQSLCHPEDASLLSGRFAITGEELLRCELRFLDGKGNPFWGRLLSKVIRDEQGNVLYLPVMLEDISAKKQDELTLQRAMQKVQIIADRIPGMISYVSSDLRYQFVNEGYERQFKRDKTDIIGRRIDEILSDDAWAIAAPNLQQALAGQQASYEWRYVDDAGNPVTRLVSVMPDGTESGEVRGLFILITDISALKRTEARLQEVNTSLRASELNLRALMESSPDTLMVVDSDGCIRYCNPRVVDMLGYTVAELLGKPVEELIPGQHRNVHRKHRQQYLKAPQARPMRLSLDLVARAKDGRELPVDIGLSPLTFDGEPMTMATIRDITGIRAAFESSGQIADIVEASGDAIFRCTLDGHIQYWSSGAEHLYGYRPAEMVGQLVDRLLPADTVADSRARIEAALARNEICSINETQRIQKNGTVIDVSVSVFPIRDTSGTVVGSASVHRDVRERKLLEAQLRHAQRLDAAGQLAGGVAHDFNNILTVIQGYCSLLHEGLPRESEVSRQVAAIENAAHRASTLTRQLLAFSQKQRREVRVIDPASLLRDLAPVLQRAIGEDVRLETDLQSSWLVLEDPASFEQVILNMAINARHAMPRGGLLRIASRDITVGTTAEPVDPGELAHTFTPLPVPPGAHVRLEITDTGAGIEPDVLTRIFEPFFTTKLRGEGTGLGLPVVYGIVRNLGGGIHLESTPGAGTRFLVYLPRTERQAEPPAGLRLPAAPRGEGNVLVVEDSPEILRLVRAVLKSAGYSVTAFPSAEEALGCEAPVDLIISDVVMPGMSGPEFVGKWRETYPDTRALFMTGYAEDSVLPFSASGRNILLKPFKPAQLLQKVAEMLAGKQA